MAKFIKELKKEWKERSEWKRHLKRIRRQSYEEERAKIRKMPILERKRYIISESRKRAKRPSGLQSFIEGVGKIGVDVGKGIRKMQAPKGRRKKRYAYKPYDPLGEMQKSFRDLRF